MRLSVASAAFAAAFVLTPTAVGYAPAWSQDFSITNPEQPSNAGRGDVLKQLQAWWDVHGYYPRRAANGDEGGIVKLRLVINGDGRVWAANVSESSGSASLDLAAIKTFRDGFVRPFPDGTPGAEIDLLLHYVLTHRHDQPMAAGYVPVSSKSAFTITNDPVTSPVLATMMQRTCTGTVVKEGIRNHPAYGGRHWVQAVFFRKPDDGTPWVKFYDSGESLIAPVNEVGKMVQWTGKEEHVRRAQTFQYQYTVWPDGENKLSGNIEATFFNSNAPEGMNTGGTVDFTCATDIVPAVTWSAWSVKVDQAPPGDPP